MALSSHIGHGVARPYLRVCPHRLVPRLSLGTSLGTGPARPLCQPVFTQAPIRDTVTSIVEEQQQQAQASSGPSSVEDLGWRVGYLAEQGLRPTMEDELHVEFDPVHGCLFAACFDGHGGPAAANWLKQHMMPMVMGHLTQAAQPLATSQAVREQFAPAFQAVDNKLLEHLESLGGEEQEHAGATATVAVVWKNRVVVANVGDSQCYVYRKPKEVNLTTPHRVYGLDPEVEEEIKRVEDTGGWVYDGRVCNVLAVSRAFGDWEFKGKGLPQLLTAGIDRGYWPASFIRSIHFTSDPIIVTPDTAELELTEEDEFMVLSTDGLWDVMPPRDVMNWARKDLQKGLTPEQVAENLVKLALKRHTSDNTSVVVLDFKGPDYWKAAKKNAGLFGFFG